MIIFVGNVEGGACTGDGLWRPVLLDLLHALRILPSSHDTHRACNAAHTRRRGGLYNIKSPASYLALLGSHRSVRSRDQVYDHRCFLHSRFLVEPQIDRIEICARWVADKPAQFLMMLH